MVGRQSRNGTCELFCYFCLLNASDEAISSVGVLMLGRIYVSMATSLDEPVGYKLRYGYCQTCIIGNRRLCVIDHRNIDNMLRT